MEAMVQYKTKSEAAIVREKKAAVVEKCLDEMDARGEKITSASLLKAAEDPAHPCHKFFLWDDTKAAHRYRLAQATHMIQATKYVAILKRQEDGIPRVVGVTEAQAANVRKLIPGRDRGEGYKKREVILANDDDRAALIERMTKRLRSWCNETSDIPEFDNVRAAILKEVGQ